MSRDFRQKYATEDPLEHSKGYGVIQNKNVKVLRFKVYGVASIDHVLQRRSGRKALPPPPAVPTAKERKPVKKAEEPKPAEAPARPSQSSSKDQERESDLKQPAQTDKPAAPEHKAGPKQPSLKRDKSDIFKSFAKAKPKLKREDTDSSAVASAPEERMWPFNTV